MCSRKHTCLSSSMAAGPGNMDHDVNGENTFDPYLNYLQKELDDPILMIGVIVALAVIVITFVFFKYFVSSKAVGSSLVLVGLCDSGKTLLYSRLVSGHYKRTQTSITDSSAPYKAKNAKGNTWTLIDLPGHDSLRPQYLEKFKSSARAFVFVVDSAIFQKEVRDVAEFLYFLLTDSVVSRTAPNLVVACNKQDITMAKSAKLIQQQLEKELNTLRVTRSAALSAQDGSLAGGTVFLGRKGRDFEFSQLPMGVDFVECSARGGGEEGSADIDDLERVLSKL